MNDEVIRMMVYTVLSELEVYLKKKYGASFNVSIGENKLNLSTPDFIITYYKPEKKFYTSFKVGLYGYEVANYSKDILMVLAPEEFNLLTDCFYDEVSRSMTYGKEAIEAKKHAVYRQSGYEKCPICEKPYKKVNITETDICKFCNPDKLVWH